MSDDKKTVFVTGGSRGIGAAIAMEFAKAGYNVAFNYLSNEEKANEVKKELEKITSVQVVKGDVSKKEDVTSMIESTLSVFGRIDVLVNNAGIMANNIFAMMSDDEWTRVLDVHVNGAFYCSKAVLTHMAARKSGVIINIASISAFRPLVGQSNYATAKGAMVTMTQALAKEMGRWKIRVNAIAPGYIQTDLMDTFNSEMDKHTIKQIPLQSVGTPEDVANLAVFLASDKARYITGETIKIDGGLHA